MPHRQVATMDLLVPARRFQMAAQGWWHPQAGVVLGNNLQYSSRTRLLALHPRDAKHLETMVNT